MPTVHIVCGLPASGKGTFVRERFPKDHLYLNRDKAGGKVADLIPVLMDALVSGGPETIVVDNTMVAVQDRAPFIDAAKKHGATVNGYWIDVSFERCQFNACWRMAEKYGHVLTQDEVKKVSKKDPNTFPPGAFFAMRKRMEKPDKSEGFDTVEWVAGREWTVPAEFTGKALILDYDGTLRETKSIRKYPNEPSDVAILPKRIEVLAKWAAQGYKLLGASNQSGISKGDLTMEQAIACFDFTNKGVKQDIEYLFDTSRGGPPQSWLRKPMPGMGVDFIWRHKLNPTECIMVGDMKTDQTFANRCGFQFKWADDFFA